MIKYNGMYVMDHGFVRVNVFGFGKSWWIACPAHEFPNEEKGIPWLRKQFESGNVKFGLRGWVAGF